MQCFLLAYRSICHEFFRSRRALRASAAMKEFDRGKSLSQQVVSQRELAALAFGQSLGMGDISEQKQRFDSMQARKDYSDIRGLVVTFENVPDVLCSSALTPECDFSGQHLQDMADFSKKLELMTFSLIATDDGGAFVFAWHNDGDAACRPLAISLAKLNDDDLPHAILRLIFEYCENHYLCSEWWDTLDERTRAAITDRLQRGSSPFEERLADRNSPSRRPSPALRTPRCLIRFEACAISDAHALCGDLAIARKNPNGKYQLPGRTSANSSVSSHSTRRNPESHAKWSFAQPQDDLQLLGDAVPHVSDSPSPSTLFLSRRFSIISSAISSLS